MIQLKRILSICVLLIGIPVAAQNNATDANKSDGLQFSLKIVKSYFKNKCSRVYKNMTDSLILLDQKKVQLLSKNDNQKKLCQSIQKAVQDPTKKYGDYLDTYQILMLTPEEVEFKFQTTLSDHLPLQSGDLFFLGAEPKPDQKSEHFIWEDMFVFLIRKVHGKWKIIGVSG